MVWSMATLARISAVLTLVIAAFLVAPVTDAAELVASAHAFGLGSIDPTGDGREILATAGSPHPAATMSAFLHFIVGHVMEEQTRAQMAQLGLIDGFDADAAAADFEWGLSVLIAGVHAMQPPPA